jgi:uncharacterized protein YdaU (DUF1376 family)
MHYYKRNIGDYAKKAGRLSLLEHGVYTLLIDACYDRERFPTLEEAIDWTWARSDDEVAAVKFVLARFFDLQDGVYVQNRIAEEIAHYHDNAEKNKRIALEREQKRTNRTRTVNEASPDVHEAPPNQEPRTTNQEPSITTTDVVVGDKPAASRHVPCPSQELIELYHQRLPTLPRVEVVSEARKRALSARWRDVVTDAEIRKTDDPRKAALEWFDWYFDYASKSAFLTGKAKSWRADFDFLLSPTKFPKVVEGHYHKDKP